jgi:ATPase family associated with various cellular activities (AAA)
MFSLKFWNRSFSKHTSANKSNEATASTTVNSKQPKTQTLVDDKAINITDDGINYKIKLKARDREDQQHLRVFITPEGQELTFYDNQTQQFHTIDQPLLRRDNFAEQNKVVNPYASDAIALAVMADLAETGNKIDGFSSAYKVIESENLMCLYPDTFLKQVYNFQVGLKNSKDEYVSSFYKYKTVELDQIENFIEFQGKYPKAEFYRLALLGENAVKIAITSLDEQDCTEGEEEDLAFAIDLSTPAFTGYLGYDQLVSNARSMVNRFMNGVKLARFQSKPAKDKLSVMLYGPPGTGKTQFMIELYKLALQTSAQGIKEKSPEFQLFKLAKTDFGSEYHNKSEKQLQAYLDKIETYLAKDDNNFALFFIDEVDEIAAKRVEAKGACDKSDNSIVTILLKCLSDKNKLKRTIFVCATNFYDNLDAAFKRPGRFDQAFHMGYIQSPETIEELFYMNFANHNLCIKSKGDTFAMVISNLAKVMAMTNTTTAAEVASIVVQVQSKIDSRVEALEDQIAEELTKLESNTDLDTAKARYLEIQNELMREQDIMEAFYATYPKLAQQLQSEAQNSSVEYGNSDNTPAFYLQPLDDSEYPIYELEANEQMLLQLELGSEYVQPGEVDLELLMMTN